MKLFRALHIWLSAVRTIREEIFPNRKELMLYNDEGQRRPLLRIVNLGKDLHSLVVDNTGYLVGLVDKDTQVAYMLGATSLPTNDEEIINLLDIKPDQVIRTGIPTNYVNTKEQLYVAQQNLSDRINILVSPLEDIM